jgi:DNA-directed RNA polymerase subunit H (RpoH/RPB5)
MSNFTTQLFKAYKTLNDLMKRQDYVVSNTLSIHELECMYENNELNAVYEKKDGASKIMTYFYLSSNSLREANLEEILETAYVEDHAIESTDILLIILKDDLNETMQETLRKKQKIEWNANKRLIIFLSVKRLQFNILDHVVVPSHQILEAAEEEEVMKRYNILDHSQFPEISRFDPVAQCIFMKPGQVCRIERMSKTAIKSFYYRCCLNI